MNIFYTAKSTNECAAHLDDKRVVKMVLETAQMLSTAMHINGGTGPYKPAYVNHPCTQWVAAAKGNYFWTQHLFCNLEIEYENRYNKIHSCFQHWEKFAGALSLFDGPMDHMTPRPCCTPGVEHALAGQDDETTMICYQIYLANKWRNDKRPPKWTNCEPPEWKDIICLGS